MVRTAAARTEVWDGFKLLRTTGGPACCPWGLHQAGLGLGFVDSLARMIECARQAPNCYPYTAPHPHSHPQTTSARSGCTRR